MRLDPLRLSILACSIPAALAVLAVAQEPEESEVRTRQLWDNTLKEKRPSAPKSATPKAVEPVKAPAQGQVQGALVGVTIWRLRPSVAADAPSVRALIQEDDNNAAKREFTPERVSSETPLLEGQKVRITVEAADAGFLYIIDRDEYSDGAKSEPFLIFPTTRTRGGDNRVSAGMTVEIPAQEDNPNYFTVSRTKPNQVSESLWMLITPKKIEGLQIGRQRLRLREDQLAAWEKLSKSKVFKLESPDQAGKAYTEVEKLAAIGTRALTHDDPVPQTLYRVESKPGDMIMVQVPLKIK